MKRSIGIGIGIGVTAILVLVVFSNVDDLVSTKIEDTTSQISKSLEEATSEIEFSNPLQTYEVDSTCKLAFMIQNRLGYGESPFKVDQEYVENVLKAEFEKKSKKMLEKYGDQLKFDPEFLKQKNLELFDGMNQELVDHVMEYNSIHSKLRDSVELVSTKAFTAEIYQEKITVLNTMYLIEPEPYRDDSQCGKQFHERFGDETFKTLKSLYGEEGAQKKYDEIKEIISDVAVTNPEEVYDPEGRMLSEEECTDLVAKRDELKKEIDEHVGKINLLKQEYYSNRDLIDVKEEIDELSNDPHFVRIARDHDEFHRQWGVGCAPFYPDK